jgi:hypothetical protein
MTLMTAMTMNCRGSLNGVRHSPEMGDGREHEEHKRDKERCRCEAQSAYLFPNSSPCSHSSPGDHDAPAVSYVAVGPIKLWHHVSKASRFSSRSPSARSACD